jgi:hypothetical protein
MSKNTICKVVLDYDKDLPYDTNINLWYSFYKMNLIEDQALIDKTFFKNNQLGLISFLVGLGLNKLLTNFKLGTFEFRNQSRLLRYPIRLLVVYLPIHFIWLNYAYKNTNILLNELGTRYLTKIDDFMKTCEPKVLNPNALNEDREKQIEFCLELRKRVEEFNKSINKSK